MGHEDYLYVRRRQDGMFGVSIRYMVNLYADEHPELPEVLQTPAPPDRNRFRTAIAAIHAAHDIEEDEGPFTFGVCYNDESAFVPVNVADEALVA